MLKTLLQEARIEVSDGVKFGYLVTIVVVLALVATMLFTFALFMWIEERHGAIMAASWIGALYLVLTVLFAALASSYRKSRLRLQEERRVARHALSNERSANLLDANWLTDPATLALGFNLARQLVSRVDAQKLLIPGAVVGIALVVALRRLSHPNAES